MTFACELNFIPSKAPYEITDFKAGQKIVDDINYQLVLLELQTKDFPSMRAKLDPFHLDESKEKPVSWSVEVCPVHYFDTIWLRQDQPVAKGEVSDWDTFKLLMDWLFDYVKERHGLVPSVRKQRGGKDIHYPSGGCHLHMGANLFPMGPRFYSRMEQFHRNLSIDFANRPYIRWLFADWMSVNAHHTLWNPTLDDKEALESSKKELEEILFCRMINGGIHAIEPRFMPSSKGSFNTFEFRIFRMVENVEELRLIALFAEAWMDHMKDRVYGSNPVTLTLSKERWESFKDGRTVWEHHIAPLLLDLALDPKDYHMFFTRNYLTRLKFGKMK